jgi:NDP-sugar pyrophosphorylase family protein
LPHGEQYTVGAMPLTALVLAGGRGERLRPFTEDRPKPMVLINDRPLLLYHLGWLQKGGVTTAYILCGYKHEVIQQYFGDGETVRMSLHYVVEQEPLGRGGALKQGMSLLAPGLETVIVTNGDILTDQSLPELVQVHREHKGMGTMMLSPLVSPYGIVAFDGQGRVEDFSEKPVLPYWVNAGVYVMDPAIRERLPDRGDHETTTFPALAKEGKLYAFRSSARWLGVDTVKDLNQARELLAGRGPAENPLSP